MFSRRSLHDPTPNRLSDAVDAARRQGHPLLDLTISNPTVAGIPYADEAILSALHDVGALRYEPEPFGHPIARAAVAGELGGIVASGRIMLSASTSEAYAWLFKLLCDPDDEVLVPVPSYPLFTWLAAFENVRLVPYRLAYDGVWHVDLPHLRAAITPRTRAIIVVNPNNPTGSYLKLDELHALASLGLPLISDEVFSTYPLLDDPTRATTALSSGATLVFALGGLSKLAGLPQLKLGWTAVNGPPDVVTAALSRLELIADTFLPVNTPVQLGLPALLAASRPTQRAIHDRIRANAAHLRRLVGTDAPLSALRVEGGWTAPLRLPRSRFDSEWALMLLDREGLIVQPGFFYDFAEEAVVVVSLLTTEDVFQRGIEHLVAFVTAHA